MRISELFEGAGPVLSVEFFPPPAGREEAFTRVASELAAEKPDFFSVTCPVRPERRPRTLETVTRLMREVGLPVMTHVVCANDHRDNVHSFLKHAHELGTENVLLLRGDRLAEYDGALEGRELFEYSSELIEHARANFPFCIAAAAHPEIHPDAANFREDLEATRLKAEKGSDFFITQFFFDNAHYFRLVAGIRALGIHLPIVPGVMPVVNVEKIKSMCEMNGSLIPPAYLEQLERVQHDDDRVLEVGYRYALNQCRDLLARGAPGIHIYSLNRSQPAVRLLQRLRMEFPERP